VLSQSYRIFEVVVVDDGSTDEVSSVASRYDEVHLIRQDNRGLAAARNMGLAEARGEYLVFLDSDDRLLGEALEVGVRELESHPGWTFVSGHYRPITADGARCAILGLAQVDGDHYPTPAIVTYRRWVVREVGGFDEALHAGGLTRALHAPSAHSQALRLRRLLTAVPKGGNYSYPRMKVDYLLMPRM